MSKRFFPGIHLPEFKELTNKKGIEKSTLPDEVILPLSQHTGAVCEPLVKVGDKVKTGTCIAKSSVPVSSPIHASISGEITAIKEVLHPVLGRGKGIVIKSDQIDCKELNMGNRENVANLSKDMIIEEIKKAGIVGLGGAGFPTHIKLSPKKKVKFYLLNGAECEPYLTCDHRLMLENPKEIVLGMQILLRALEIDKGYIGIEQNKRDAILQLKKAVSEINDCRFKIEIIALRVKYPQGAEKQLIKAIFGKEVPSGGLPYDLGVMVNNVATAYAVYEAIYFNKPLYERVITISGSCVKDPKNLRVRIGTKFSHLIAQCGGIICPAAKIIMGGPMMGIAQESLDVPVIKGTSGILLFNAREAKGYKDSPCVRCGRCLEHCPMQLMPNMIGSCVEYKKFNNLSQYSPLDCIECGICAYVCGAKRPLVQLIRRAKQEVRKKK
ncbi:MAG: electron transport complex subunit RsxC [Candidatus Omnitrophota bacterium]